MGDRRVAHRVLVGRPKGKRPLGKLRHRWEDIKLNLQKWDRKTWTGYIWLMIGTGSGFL